MIIPKSTILREAPHQIYFKILNMLYLLINYYFEEKNQNISAFQLKFSYFFIQSSSCQGDQLSLKLAIRPSSPFNAGTCTVVWRRDDCTCMLLGRARLVSNAN